MRGTRKYRLHEMNERLYNSVLKTILTAIYSSLISVMVRYQCREKSFWVGGLVLRDDNPSSDSYRRSSRLGKRLAKDKKVMRK